MFRMTKERFGLLAAQLAEGHYNGLSRSDQERLKALINDWIEIGEGKPLPPTASLKNCVNHLARLDLRAFSDDELQRCGKHLEIWTELTDVPPWPERMELEHEPGTEADFFPLDIILRRLDGIDPQELAEATGLTIICDAYAATVGAGCWQATLLPPTQASAAYTAAGGTVSRIYSP